MADATDRDTWVLNVLGVKTSGGDAVQGLPTWRVARKAAISQLTALEGKISEMDHPRGDAAILLVQAIRKNLTAEPVTPQQVNELRRYIETDDIIGDAERPNGFGLRIDIRAPLLDALGGIRAG